MEVQAFFCQYFFTRLSSAIAYAITINGGDKYIVKRVGDEYVIGSPNVESATLKILKTPEIDPSAGVIIVSDDSCVRIKLNSQPLYGGERNLALTPNAYYNNIVIKIWGCAITQDGICGAQKLSTQYINPESDENLFTTPQKPALWQELCEFCQEDGAALTPPGCPAPPGGGDMVQPGCEFLRPFGSPRDKECIPDESSRPRCHRQQRAHQGLGKQWRELRCLRQPEHAQVSSKDLPGLVPGPWSAVCGRARRPLCREIPELRIRLQSH